MQKWETIIVDFSEGLYPVVKQFLEMDCPQMKVVAIVSDIYEAENLINQLQPHLLIIDIQDNNTLPFELLQRISLLGLINFEVIFVIGGAQNDLYTKAINFAYLDCLSKPIDPRNLKQITDKITNHYTPGLPNTRINILLNLINNREETKFSTVPFLTEELRWLQMEDVEYLRADSLGTICSFGDSRSKLFSHLSLSTYKKWMPSGSPFLAVSGSFLVNMQKVRRFSPKKHVLYMQSGEQIMVAFNCINQILAELSAHKKYAFLLPGSGFKRILKRIFSIKA